MSTPETPMRHEARMLHQQLSRVLLEQGRDEQDGRYVYQELADGTPVQLSTYWNFLHVDRTASPDLLADNQAILQLSVAQEPAGAENMYLYRPDSIDKRAIGGMVLRSLEAADTMHGFVAVSIDFTHTIPLSWHVANPHEHRLVQAFLEFEHNTNR